MDSYIFSILYKRILNGQGLSHFLAEELEAFLQLIRNEVSDCIPNIL